MADSDDLSRTATEHARGTPVDEASAETMPASPDAKRVSAPKVLPDKIGKYRIERELGEGGMGVVYVAFDPDLERRVALKVLRAATSSEAAKRLQREARAMARLKHGNVVTVHEVATAAGRDYVAMELVEGESLAEWLRGKTHTQTSILDAFVQAGRGLAAAHAAGIVHRDFKPHNVLRDRAGHVSVTDFGLAREAHEVGDPLAVTMPLASDSGSSKSSSLAGLTVTGALLGTPAYMAPEQWTGGAMTPATDQFAYCVALWEGVTGARPFTGPTVEVLRAQILEGSSELDASKLPRELRAPLVRGLNADPKKRWPSMDALLAAITPPPPTQSPRLRLIRIAFAGAAGIIAIVGMVKNKHEAKAPAMIPCAAPAMALETVWNDAKRTALRDHGRTLAVAQLDADATAWSAARRSACAAASEVRGAKLACLDAVLGRFDVAVAAVTATTGASYHPEAGAILVDPALCVTDHPPKLAVPSPELRDALSMQIALDKRDVTDAQLVALATKVDKDPCAAMYAHAQRATQQKDPAIRRAEADLSEQGAERCTDERARADEALVLLFLELKSQFAAASVQKKLRQAQVAVEPVTQTDLRARLDEAIVTIAIRSDDLPHALQASDSAVAGYAARSRVHREIDMGLEAVGLYQMRATPEDLVEMGRRMTALRARAVAILGPTSETARLIDQTDAYWAFLAGSVADSHARLLALQKALPITAPVTCTGKVVDENGKPTAGATVVAGGYFVGDEVSIALPAPEVAGSMRTVTTAADGSFTVESVRDGIVVAQLGDKRSYSAATGQNITLQLRPTSRVEGKVDLRGLPAVRALVAFIPDKQDPLARYATATSVASDGSFHSTGVPRGKTKVVVIVNGLLGQSVGSATVDIEKPSVTGVQLVAPSNRTVYVVLRSSVGLPIANAQVLVGSGTFNATNLAGLRTGEHASAAMRLATPVLGDKVPPEVKAVSHDGDLYVALTGAPTGAGTACAIPLPADISDQTKLQRTVEENLTKIPTACKPIAPDANVVVVDVPPWPRLE